MNPMNAGTQMRSRIVDRGKVLPHTQNMVRFSNEFYNEQRMVRQQATENPSDEGFVDNWGAGVARVVGEFAVDDSVLADAVDMDPSGEQFGTWMGTSSQMSQFALACSLSSYSTSAFANSRPPSMLYANAGLPEFLQTLQQETMNGPFAGSCHNISQMMHMSEPMLEMQDRRVSLQSCGEGETSELSENVQVAEPYTSRSKSRAMARAVPASLPPLSPLRDRLVQAVRLIGRLRPNTLVQAWVPVCSRNGSRKRVLSTREQPYALEHKNNQLWFFRTMSESFEFATEEGDASHVAGVPGRVFARQVPEWSPNVQLYSSLEYPRWKEAQRCDIRGSLAVPVLDPNSRGCAAVIELVGRVEKVQFGPDVDIVVRAVQVLHSFLHACVLPISAVSSVFITYAASIACCGS